jgi:hypothetical protein
MGEHITEKLVRSEIRRIDRVKRKKDGYPVSDYKLYDENRNTQKEDVSRNRAELEHGWKKSGFVI